MPTKASFQVSKKQWDKYVSDVGMSNLISVPLFEETKRAGYIKETAIEKLLNAEMDLGGNYCMTKDELTELQQEIMELMEGKNG